MNMYYNKENDSYTTVISEKPDENALAYAIYNKSYEYKGWDFLSISSYAKKDKKYNDTIKSYAMGYLEGILTKDKIHQFYTNIIRSNFNKEKYLIPHNVLDFYKQNLEYMEEKSTQYMNSDPYWEQVHYIYQQLKGLYEGYNNNVEDNQKIDFIKFQIMPGYTDYIDIEDYYENEENKLNFNLMTFHEIKNYIIRRSHCSALIKLDKDFNDIWVGHNTWDYYNNMIKIFKEYRFISNNQNEKSKLSAFPSYPATLCSLDDFYYLDSKLIVMETTNSIFNDTLFENINPQTLLTWVRTIIANRLASSSEDWTNIFKKENSGTYNNQFMILDMNKIDFKNKKLEDKSLMIIEQLPGYTETNDVTNYLRDGYWPSYNVPFSEYIFNISMYPEMLENNTDLYDDIDYKTCARAKIFEREQKLIGSNEDIKKILRYNDYQNDELSKNNSGLTLASRYDLREDENNTYCFGATDAKFVSVKELLENKKKIYLIAGPTNDQQPTFSWENATCNKGKEEDYYYEGNVITWNFPWIEYDFQLISDNKSDKSDKSNKEGDDDNNSLIIILCIVISVVIIAIIIVVIWLLKKRKYQNIKDNIEEISKNKDGEDYKLIEK